MPRPPVEGDWTIETAMVHLVSLINANDQRYAQRFDAAQQALQLGFSAQKAAVDAALAAADRAVMKAELAAEKRFEGLNEFRGTLADQQRTLIPRAEVEVVVKSLTDKMAALEKAQDAQAAERTGAKLGWGAAVAFAGFALTIVSIVVLAIRVFSV